MDDYMSRLKGYYVYILYMYICVFFILRTVIFLSGGTGTRAMDIADRAAKITLHAVAARTPEQIIGSRMRMFLNKKIQRR